VLNLDIIAGRLEGPRLVRDYYAGAPPLARFFSGSPWDAAAYERRAAAVSARFGPAERARLAGALRPTSEAAARRLEALVREGGFFVTTGQQAGLFTGPLLTVYKALSAVRLAQVLEQQLGRTVLPVFWVASTDHDFEEIDHVDLLDAHNALRHIGLPADPDAAPASMARRRLGEGIAAALDALAGVLPASDFVEPLLRLMRESYRPEATVAQAFGDALAGLLGRFDIVLADPSHPVLARLAAPVLGRELEDAAAHEAALERQTERLLAAGYHAQVAVGGGVVNVAYEDEAGRERLVLDEGGFLLRRTKRRFTREAMRQLLEAAPERFSPTALLRPVVESTMFPTLAYVAGPAELSYFAQTGCVFRAHGLEMPLVFPRASVVLVERKVAKVLEKTGLAPEDFRQPVPQLAERVLREDVPPEVDDAVTALRRGLDDGYRALGKAAARLDPTLAGPLESAHNTSQAALRDVEKKIMAHVKDRNAIVVEQLEKASGNLFPEGTAQERLLSSLQYLARYGPELLPAIARALPVELGAPAPEWNGVECATA
jgi:bacillithiol biosynthesis cysteine-adding enzyme BshC